jgi:hypothetical protein
VSISSYLVLANNLLPQPDSFVINDRQRASANGYLLDPSAKRNYTDLQHLLPKYQFVPKSAFLKYRNISPAKFHVNRNLTPSAVVFPVFTLFDPTRSTSGVSNASTVTSPSPTSTTTIYSPSGTATTGSTATTSNAAISATPTVTGNASVSAQTPVVNQTTTSGQASSSSPTQALNTLVSLGSSGNTDNVPVSALQSALTSIIQGAGADSTGSTQTNASLPGPTTGGGTVPTAKLKDGPTAFVTATMAARPITTITAPPPTPIAPTASAGATSTTRAAAAATVAHVAKPKAKSKNIFKRIFG